MDTLLRVAAGLPAIGFVLIAVGWWVAPATMSAQLGMPLLDGVGLSSQIGDLASFFATAGGCVLIGLSTGNRVWYYPSIMLLGVAATGRIVAWLVHDAALAYDLIAIEAAVVIVLVLVSRNSTQNNARESAQ